MSIFTKLFRKNPQQTWQQIDKQTYQQAYEQYGGSVITHPEIITKISAIIDIPLTYQATYTENKLIAAIPTWGKYIAGHKQALKKTGKKSLIDYGNAEIILPIAPEHKITLPITADNISEINHPQINNLKPSKQKQIALAKNPQTQLNKKFRYNRKREWQQLQQKGATSQNIQTVTPEEISNTYLNLFHQRWGFQAASAQNMQKTITALHPWLHGQIITIKDKPIAIQIIYAIETKHWHSLEYVNGGYDPAWQQHSPGSILTYLNLTQAQEKATKTQKKLRYSFGKADDPYKLRWCTLHNIYQTKQ